MGAEWDRVVFAEGNKYRVCCGGLMGTSLSCDVLGEGQAGICIKFNVVGAAAVALACSSAP